MAKPQRIKTPLAAYTNGIKIPKSHNVFRKIGIKRATASNALYKTLFFAVFSSTDRAMKNISAAHKIKREAKRAGFTNNSKKERTGDELAVMIKYGI